VFLKRGIVILLTYITAVHHSLVQPLYYRKIVTFSRKQVIRFFLFLLIASSLLSSISDTWYLLYGKNALPKTLAAAFPELEIQNGTLQPRMGSPYSPPAYLLSPIFNQLLKLPEMLHNEADSLVIIDTASPPVVAMRIPMVLMGLKTVTFFFNEKTKMEFPYEHILSGATDFRFTEEDISRHMTRYIFGIFIGYLFSTLIHNCGMFLFSIFFLSVAAFIFRVDRQRLFRQYLKIAVYAVTPIVVGGVLVSFAGVKIQWVWHVLIFLSTIVMFRAIVALGNERPSSGENA